MTTRAASLFRPLPTSKIRRLRAAEALSYVEAVRLRLDNGEVCAFDIASEVRIERKNIRATARNAPSDYAFWAYAAARAKANAQSAKRRLERIEARDLIAFAQSSKQRFGSFVSGDQVRAFVTMTPEVRSARKKFDRLQHAAELVEGIRAAMDHRLYVLRKLVQANTDRSHETRKEAAT